MKTRKRFRWLQLSPEDRTELQQMQRSRKALTARVWRRIRVLLLLDGGHTVRATAIAAGGYPREISRVGKRYLRGGLQHALTEDPRPKPSPKLVRKLRWWHWSAARRRTADRDGRCGCWLRKLVEDASSRR